MKKFGNVLVLFCKVGLLLLAVMFIGLAFYPGSYVDHTVFDTAQVFKRSCVLLAFLLALPIGVRAVIGNERKVTLKTLAKGTLIMVSSPVVIHLLSFFYANCSGIGAQI